ncbi:MAG TPA: galactokinase family protein [Solirubrobacteraceae bacterium]|nr:galactokinase family protein [Solirubrobacteraceae bacterium]
MPPDAASAFAPGRINLIGEHTDYNLGFALPFAIADGITAHAELVPGSETVDADAVDLGESDRFAVADPEPAEGWRAFARGIVAELRGAGVRVPGARVRFGGSVRTGAGMSSSAALEVALCLALRAISGEDELDRVAIAQLCSRVENEWVGARTGLLDQLASLYGARESALRIDFRSLEIEQVPLRLGRWQLATLDSGERHVHASSGYNERRAECARACELLGIDSLRDVDPRSIEDLPPLLAARARHVVSENERVLAAIAALAADDMPALAVLLNAAHASLRDDYEASTPAVEGARERLLESGAAGARMIGGGFGGSVLGLFPPGVAPPREAMPVAPGPGAHLI